GSRRLENPPPDLPVLHDADHCLLPVRTEVRPGDAIEFFLLLPHHKTGLPAFPTSIDWDVPIRPEDDAVHPVELFASTFPSDDDVLVIPCGDECPGTVGAESGRIGQVARNLLGSDDDVRLVPH